MMEHDVVERCLQGNQSALAFVREIASVLHFFDDCVDRDKPITDADVHAALFSSLVTLPRNDFYREHFAELNPILVNSIVNWRIANALERGADNGADNMRIAFIIRSSYVDLLTMSATIIGGVDWAVQHGTTIRQWAHAEKFSGYLNNLAAESAARRSVDVLR